MKDLVTTDKKIHREHHRIQLAIKRDLHESECIEGKYIFCQLSILHFFTPQDSLVKVVIL